MFFAGAHYSPVNLCSAAHLLLPTAAAQRKYFIQRAVWQLPRLAANVQVLHGGFYIGVAQQLLHSNDVYNKPPSIILKYDFVLP